MAEYRKRDQQVKEKDGMKGAGFPDSTVVLLGVRFIALGGLIPVVLAD
jgi:hypothetical protein